MATARDLTPEELAGYRAAARRRHQAEQRALALREQQAWKLARQAAALLRDQFGAERVVVFGSLVHPGWFNEWSDVDIAAWGIRPRDTLRAMGAVLELSGDIAVHLVDTAACREPILRTIERDGVAL
jgi:predicted nucleotidyltransferase